MCETKSERRGLGAIGKTQRGRTTSPLGGNRFDAKSGTGLDKIWTAALFEKKNSPRYLLKQLLRISPAPTPGNFLCSSVHPPSGFISLDYPRREGGESTFSYKCLFAQMLPINLLAKVWSLRRSRFCRHNAGHALSSISETMRRKKNKTFVSFTIPRL